MAATAMQFENLVLDINEEIHVKAPMETTFAALLEEIGPGAMTGDGVPMPMKVEQRPGGRWYRDLGGESGHLWGHVQAIKPPTLIEFYGPLFMSAPVTNNVQYRLSEEPGGTLIKFHHRAFGIVPDEYRRGVTNGWGIIHARVQKRAEGQAGRKS